MEPPGVLIISKHKAGFFSCCSIQLLEIICFFKQYKALPCIVNSSLNYVLYKPEPNINVTDTFFSNYNDIDISLNYNLDFCSAEIMNIYDQFHNYKTLDFKRITPFIKKYFTPSATLQHITYNLVDKYNINTENCIGLYYRGTDKMIETRLGSFESYYIKLKEILHTIPSAQIVIQSDSAPFVDYLKSKSLLNVIIIEENSQSYNNNGIHNEKTSAENFRDMQSLMATFLIIAKCKFVICSSGNCSVWMMYFRGNANNVSQHLNGYWL
jgi:hypothetical protein